MRPRACARSWRSAPRDSRGASTAPLTAAHERANLLLAGGDIYAAVMASVHLLTFPGVFSRTGLLGAGAQTTAYLYVFWHLGLPLAVIG